MLIVNTSFVGLSVYLEACIFSIVFQKCLFLIVLKRKLLKSDATILHRAVFTSIVCCMGDRQLG